MTTGSWMVAANRLSLFCNSLPTPLQHALSCAEALGSPSPCSSWAWLEVVGALDEWVPLARARWCKPALLASAQQLRPEDEVPTQFPAPPWSHDLHGAITRIRTHIYWKYRGRPLGFSLYRRGGSDERVQCRPLSQSLPAASGTGRTCHFLLSGTQLSLIMGAEDQVVSSVNASHVSSPSRDKARAFFHIWPNLSLF